MAHLIDKDALVAWIISRCHPVVVPSVVHYDDWEMGADNERQCILSFLDTLKVEEVDLEKEVCDWYDSRYKPIDKRCSFEKYSGHWMKKSTIIGLARHFYELGLLKAQKGG